MNTKYKFVLSERVIGIIGEKYRSINNKFFIRHASSNNKPQLIKSAYKKQGYGFEWFVDLYDKNGVGNIVTFTVDEIKKTLTVDIDIKYKVETISVELPEEVLQNNYTPGYNKIFYGIPGCGKSWHIENRVLAGVNKKEDVFRTTFFLDYSNSDFVGQIYPVVDDDKVKYEYVPGPFTKALERALTVEDDHMVYLVIEEINRGNAAAIFGDLFQLLDRLNISRDGRVKGDSEYPISNQFIEGYFNRRNEHGALIPFEEGNIYIPHNLTILATMNTSDQNVFPLDTAFQRRWDREKVVAKLEGSEYADLYVPGTEIKWKDFAAKTNFHMIEDCGDKSVTEDKNLGAYFATDAMLCYEDDAPEVKKEKAIRFANNVMEYLFGTAVKFAPEILFDKEYDRYQKVYDEMESFMFDVDQSEAFLGMLAKNLREDIKKTMTSSPAPEEDGE